MNIMEMKIIHSKRNETCGRIFKCDTGNIMYKFSAFHIDQTADCRSESLGIWFEKAYHMLHMKFCLPELKGNHSKCLRSIMVIQ